MQQILEEFKQQVEYEEYERRLDDVMGSLEQTNCELKVMGTVCVCVLY